MRDLHSGRGDKGMEHVGRRLDFLTGESRERTTDMVTDDRLGAAELSVQR